MKTTKAIRSVVRGLLDALSAAAKGDERPLLIWWIRGMPEIERVLTGYGLDPSESEDAAQCVLIKVWQAVTRGQTPCEELPWLARLTRNVAADAIRQRSRRPPSLSAKPVDLVSPDDPQTICCTGDDVRRGIQIIQCLGPPYRHIARLQYISGCSRRNIVTFLQLWSASAGGPISPHHARYLIQETHRMLRALGAGQPWPSPGRQKRKNTRWNSHPPFFRERNREVDNLSPTMTADNSCGYQDHQGVYGDRDCGRRMAGGTVDDADCGQAKPGGGNWNDNDGSVNNPCTNPGADNAPD